MDVLWAGDGARVRETLVSLGMQVTRTRPDRCQQLVATRAPDLLVLSGSAAAQADAIVRALREQQPGATLPVLVISGEASQAVPQRGGLVTRVPAELAQGMLAAEIQECIGAASSLSRLRELVISPPDIEGWLSSALSLQSAGFLMTSAGAIAFGPGGRAAPSPESLQAALAGAQDSHAVKVLELPANRVLVLNAPPARGATADLSAVQMVVVHPERERGEQLSAELVAAGAVAQALGVEADEIARVAGLAPALIVIAAAALQRPSTAALWQDARLGSASWLVLDESRLAALPPSQILAPAATLIAQGRSLRQRLASRELVLDRIESFGAAGWLRELGRCEPALTLLLQSSSGKSEISLAGGKIRSASFTPAGGGPPKQGQAALQASLALPFGRVLVGPHDAVMARVASLEADQDAKSADAIEEPAASEIRERRAADLPGEQAAPAPQRSFKPSKPAQLGAKLKAPAATASVLPLRATQEVTAPQAQSSLPSAPLSPPPEAPAEAAVERAPEQPATPVKPRAEAEVERAPLQPAPPVKPRAENDAEQAPLRPTTPVRPRAEDDAERAPEQPRRPVKARAAGEGRSSVNTPAATSKPRPGAEVPSAPTQPTTPPPRAAGESPPAPKSSDAASQQHAEADLERWPVQPAAPVQRRAEAEVERAPRPARPPEPRTEAEVERAPAPPTPPPKPRADAEVQRAPARPARPPKPRPEAEVERAPARPARPPKPRAEADVEPAPPKPRAAGEAPHPPKPSDATSTPRAAPAVDTPPPSVSAQARTRHEDHAPPKPQGVAFDVALARGVVGPPPLRAQHQVPPQRIEPVPARASMQQIVEAAASSAAERASTPPPLRKPREAPSAAVPLAAWPFSAPIAPIASELEPTPSPAVLPARPVPRESRHPGGWAAYFIVPAAALCIAFAATVLLRDYSPRPSLSEPPPASAVAGSSAAQEPQPTAPAALEQTTPDARPSTPRPEHATQQPAHDKVRRASIPRGSEAAKLLERAKRLREESRHKDAEAQLSQLLDLYPDDFSVRYHMALTLVRLRRFEEAHAQLARALELNDESASAWLLEGDIFLQEGRRREAVRAWDRCLAIEADLPTCHERLARWRTR